MVAIVDNNGADVPHPSTPAQGFSTAPQQQQGAPVELYAAQPQGAPVMPYASQQQGTPMVSHAAQQQLGQGHRPQPELQRQPTMIDGTAPVVGVTAGRGPVQDWQTSFWDCFSPSEICERSPPCGVSQTALMTAAQVAWLSGARASSSAGRSSASRTPAWPATTRATSM